MTALETVEELLTQNIDVEGTEIGDVCMITA